MADNKEATTSSAKEGAPTATGRSPPFSREELEFMVTFLDNANYEATCMGNPYKRKTKIMRKLSQRFAQKFGTDHDRRQIKKRYSDLKVRQKKLLRNIRQHIAILKEQNPLEETEAEDFFEDSGDQLESTVLEETNVLEDNEPSMDIEANQVEGCEDQMVTLTLFEIQTNEGNREDPVVTGAPAELSSIDLKEVVEEMKKIKEFALHLHLSVRLLDWRESRFLLAQ